MDDLTSTDACTLPTAERPLRLAEFDALFASVCSVTRRSDGGIRMHLAGEPGLLDHVRDLAERETACCSFFTFEFRGTDQDLVLEVSVPPERRDILDAFAARAERAAGTPT